MGSVADLGRDDHDRWKLDRPSHKERKMKMPATPQIELKVHNTKREDFELRLTAEQIKFLLRKAGHDIPNDCAVTVQVPGGGDWSNMTLDIDKTCPLKVSWQRITETDQ